MKISVLIPTYCRKEWLVRTLGCVARQSYRDFEVIIVDASTEEDQLSEEELIRLGLPVNYIRYGKAGNVSKQRNIALREATGDVLLFIDDDVEFGEDLFLNYCRLFSKGNYEAISGLVETKKYRRGSKPILNTSSRLFDIGRENYQPCDFEVKTHVICTANFAFLRRVYERVGGFDEKIYGVLDDVDYGLQLEREGVTVVHHPAVAVFHFQATTTGARSSMLPRWWPYYNICYFHFKNRAPNRLAFFLHVSWQMLRPSRAWFNFTKLGKSYISFSEGFLKARTSIAGVLQENF